MKHHKKILAVALLTVTTSSAQAFEIDFEDQSVGSFSAPPISSLTIDNVTFDSISGIDNNGTGSFIISDYSNPAEINPDYSDQYLTNGGRGFSSLKISFANAVSEFSFNFGENNEDWTLEAFDVDNTPLGNLTINNSGTSSTNNKGDFFGLSSSLEAGISYATLSLSSAPAPSAFFLDDITLDNLRYTEVSPVPEPSTYALMLGGLGMVGFMAYRRRKATNA